MRARTILAAMVAGALGAASPPVGAASPVPAGWKLVKDHRGSCQMIVPVEWKGGVSAASSEDHQAKASIHLLPGKNWEDSKEMAQQVMAPTQVIEDSAIRLWYAYGNNGGETDWYISVPSPLGPCTGQVAFKNETLADTARLIATSVAAAPTPR